ncbi:pinhead-like protein [Apostichopus japonicus]|uniref:Pinhead-like protein n=1 Tax=Stichopus japonicus TaxID=307972 RepID=A0A2G8KD85_STIJA|nr:pinhead-like protein [Apostichopus japonicus]
MSVFVRGTVTSFSFINRPRFQDGNIKNPNQATESIPLDYSSSSMYSVTSTSSRPTESSTSYTSEPMDETMGYLPTVCKRIQRNTFIGRDATGKEYLIDTGQCSHVTLTPNQSPALPQQSVEICNTTSPCDITRIRTESNTLLTGVEHYDIVESCECHKLREHCAKVSLYKTFFPNSPFEVQIDVGTCRGDCVKENCDGCFPTETVSKSIEGPNGDECVEKIERCSCTSACYRASHFQTYYVKRWDRSSNSSIVELRKFDVGKCIGICSPTPFCIIWDPSSGKCLSSISTSSRCKATAFDTHSFTTPDGKEKMLISIGNCVCA